MGARGGGAPVFSGARAGTVAGDLERRAGDFVAQTADREDARRRATRLARRRPRRTSRSQREFGKDADPVVRQGLAQAHILGEITRLTPSVTRRSAPPAATSPASPNFSKLLMGHILRHNRDLGLASSAPGHAARLRR